MFNISIPLSPDELPFFHKISSLNQEDEIKTTISCTSSGETKQQATGWLVHTCNLHMTIHLYRTVYNQTLLIIPFKLLVWFWFLPVTLEMILMSQEQYTQPVKHVSCSVFKNKKNWKTAILEKIRMPPGREMPTIKRCVPRHSGNQYNHQILCNTCIQLQRTLRKPQDILQTQQQTKRNETLQTYLVP